MKHSFRTLNICILYSAYYSSYLSTKNVFHRTKFVMNLKKMMKNQRFIFINKIEIKWLPIVDFKFARSTYENERYISGNLINYKKISEFSASVVL